MNPDGLVEEVEKELYNEVAACEKDLEKPLASRDYTAVLERLGSLKDPIDRFFEGVLVLDQDLTLRQNRLALLTRIAGLFARLGDFSRIVL